MRFLNYLNEAYGMKFTSGNKLVVKKDNSMGTKFYTTNVTKDGLPVEIDGTNLPLNPWIIRTDDGLITDAPTLKRAKQRLEKLVKEQQYLSEDVSNADIKQFENKWLAKLKPMGLTAFEFSSHMGKRDFRINRKENIPPITADELDFVMTAFVSKIASQLKKDIQAVANNTAKKTHPLGMKNKNDVPPNNIEYVIKSKSTNINLAIALHQDKKQGGEMGSVSNRGMKGTAVIVPMTILRKKGFVTNRGVEVIVERRVI
jgi:hypothetical protein